MKKITDTGMLRVTLRTPSDPLFGACATEVIIRDGAGELTITPGTPPCIRAIGPGGILLRKEGTPDVVIAVGHGTLVVAGNEVRCVVSGAAFGHERVMPQAS